jgi:hypothetical protein
MPEKPPTASTGFDYAPAAGRLAAAMATIWARWRRIRDGAVRSNELIRRMVGFPFAPVREILRNPMAHNGKWCQPRLLSRRAPK